MEALVILENALGKADPWYARTRSGLTFLYELESRYEESDALMAEALPLEQATIARGITFLSEQELASYIEVQQQNSADLIAYLYARPSIQVSVLPDLTYDQVLFQKGFLLQAAARLQTLATSTPEATEISSDLKAYRRRIAGELSKPPAERQDLEELDAKANALEQQLARTIAGYAEAQKQVHWKEVQNALPGDAIALEFINFEVTFPDLTDSIMYGVLLLRPGASQPLFIPLFEEKEFNHLLDANKERKADYVNELYAWADRGMVKLGQEKKSLYDLIWSKIEETGLEGIKTVYYSPSGVLHRLNLSAIAVDDETILSDRYNLVALNSTRQLGLPSNDPSQTNDALLVGGVNFEVETTHPELDDQPLLASRSASEVQASTGTRGGSWSFLKWTEKEVERIAATIAPEGYQVDTLFGSNADEETIKAIGLGKSSPRVLHIATHGFFFPDPELAPSFRRGLGEAEPVFKSSDNPMIRSGLILAGGNYAWQHGQAVSPDKEDGILTAYEISQMNLSNTELVVLSACETGLGDIQGNEGVYGLQRAFKIAGAKYLIMSLWQVPDRETMEFMTTFYRNWLEEEMTIPDAFRKTQREMRDRFFNPYSWAGFVLVE